MLVLDSATDEFRSHLIIMVDAILFAKQGILHPAIWSPKQLWTAAEKIKNATTYEFPLTPTELLSEQINGITELKIVCTEGRALFQLTVPLLDSEFFNLYRIHSNPSTQSYRSKQLTLYVKPTAPYMAMSMDERTYATPNIQFIRNCFHHHKQVICQGSLPMYKTEAQPICEVELLRKPNQDTWKKCDVQVSLLAGEIWEPLESKQAWLYYVLRAEAEGNVNGGCEAED